MSDQATPDAVSTDPVTEAADHLHPQSPEEKLAIDTVRVLAMDAVQAANSGHPGTPMALAPVGYSLYTKHLRHNPKNPGWMNRDRFILSCGHASMLQYALLHLTGYDLSLDDLKDFRQWDSKTPGHPEYGHTAGVETTTGPLGQGVANSVGMAMAERWLAHRFNKPTLEIVDHYTYVLCSDGDLMEGISHEAAELAGRWKLGKLIWIFDDNRITIDGDTDLSTCTDQVDRFKGYGWQVLELPDGEDLVALDAAIEAGRANSQQPTLIVLRTVIGQGSPNMAGSEATHGAPLGADEIAATKENLRYPSQEPFFVADEALAKWRRAEGRGEALESQWSRLWDNYQAAHPDEARELEAFMEGRLPDGWDDDLPDPGANGHVDASRGYSGAVIQSLAERIPNLIGGSADLAGSNKTHIKAEDSLLPESPGGRNMHFGVREHAMGAIMNGMALHGGVRVFAGTFLIFSDYMRPAIRLASLMGLPTTYVFTHDSIGVGEDGPTHQPVEQVSSMRAIPGVMDLRPATGAETLEAWKAALPAGHRCRDAGGVEGRAEPDRRAGVPGPHAAEARRVRGAVRRRVRCDARRLRVQGGVVRSAPGDPHRVRLRTGRGGGRPGGPGGRGDPDARSQPPVVASLPAADPDLSGRRAATRCDGSSLGRSRDHLRLGALGRKRRDLGGHRPLRGVGPGSRREGAGEGAPAPGRQRSVRRSSSNSATGRSLTSAS
jgi:transketolase